MSNELIEIIVEEIMRQQNFNDYENYINENVRENYKKTLQENQDARSKKLY